MSTVELTFRELGPALTRVQVEHRGWEKLTDAQFAALAERRESYDNGCAKVLRLFSEAASTRTESSS